MLVGAHNGGIDHHVFVVGIARQQLENAPENPALGPPVEALVDDFPIPETRWKITPRHARSIPEKNGFDEQTIIPVGSIRRVVCGSPAYFAKRGTPKNPDELRSHDCITFEWLTSADAWTFKTGKSEASVAIHSRLVVNTAEAAIDAAIAGVGITRALVPNREFRAGRCARRRARKARAGTVACKSRFYRSAALAAQATRFP
jgi:DNA-binding transcriptional LysR family regulator